MALKRFWLLSEGAPVGGYSFVAPGADDLFVQLKRLGGTWHSRRGLWEIPEENLAKALGLSPRLKVLSRPATPVEVPAPAKPAEKPPEVKPISAEKPPEAPAPSAQGQNKILVYNAEPRQYNRVKVQISSLDLPIKHKLNVLMDDYFKAKKMPMDVDQLGNSSYNKKREQHFQKALGLPDIYWISPNVLESMLGLFKTAGYKISFQDDSHMSEAPGRPRLRVLGEEDTEYGRKIVVTYKLDFSTNIKLREELVAANLWPRGLVYMGKDQEGLARYGLSMQSPDVIAKVVQILRKYVDTAELDEKLSGSKVGSSAILPEDQLRFIDQGGNKMSVKIPFIKNAKLLAMAKQITTYTFPENAFNWETKAWDVNGDFQQYSLYKKLLKRYGWDTSVLEQVIASKLKSGNLKQESLEGEIPEGFEGKIETELPDSDFELNQLQKEGVAFLHHRRSAILGDETGFGKTVQLVSAAEMKMKEMGYKGDTLIIVPKQGGTTVEQWQETILKVIGEKNGDLISLNPLQPRRWTILWYEMFSIPDKMKAKADAIIKSLKEHNFLIIIMDELHKVKKPDATKTKNILEIIAGIPIHWGASATISSNWPIDVRNQLAMVGHHLGRIGEGKFKRDFAGMVPKGYNNAYVPGDIEDQIRAAENLNKWLHLTGLYVRRSKEDVRDMPGLTVSEKNAPFDYKDYENRMSVHINRLKNPELVISILNAAREELAVSKVPATVARVMDLVKQGRKVVVFTTFLEAGALLKAQLRASVKTINPEWDILTYTSDTHKSERALAKGRFTNDPRYRIILMSIKMGGTGIDFPNAAQNMVVNDYDWTPEQAEQSEGRIYRITTEKPVTIEYMIANGTIDEALFSKVQQKRELASIIQKYRKDYQEEKEPEKALEQIIKYRKQLEELNAEIKKLRIEAARMFNPKAREKKSESTDYINA